MPMWIGEEVQELPRSECLKLSTYFRTAVLASLRDERLPRSEYIKLFTHFRTTIFALRRDERFPRRTAILYKLQQIILGHVLVIR